MALAAALLVEVISDRVKDDARHRLPRVMAGLEPAIFARTIGVVGRVKPGHDERQRAAAANDESQALCAPV